MSVLAESPPTTAGDAEAGGKGTAADRVLIKARRSQDGASIVPPFLSVPADVKESLSEETTIRDDEPKRKRDVGTEEDLKRTIEATRNKGDEATENTFPSVPPADIPAPKRNQSKEQHKCQVEYKTPAQTDFTSESDENVKFTASPPHSPAKSKHPTRQRKHRSSCSENTVLSTSPSKTTLSISPSKLDTQGSAGENGHTEHKNLDKEIDKCAKDLRECDIAKPELKENE